MTHLACLTLFALGCALHRGEAARSIRNPELRYREGPAPLELVDWLAAGLPGARWDPGLEAAARELAAASSDAGARLSPAATRVALARAGFPGDARFARLYTAGGLPDALLPEAAAARGAAPGLDVALASRRFGDGTVLWILGVAPHWAGLCPMPRDLALDEPLPLEVETGEGRALTLFAAPPSGPVAELEFSPDIARWVDLFHVPGEHRLEVVDLAPGRGRVLLSFSVFVEEPPPPPARLPTGFEPLDPVAATFDLYRALDERRRQAGLAPLARYPDFEPLAREHAAMMAQHGVLAHSIPGVTEGVAAAAWQAFHPRARHREDLAAAYGVDEALELVWNSPGHRRNLLCEDCTHVSIGVALEPIASGPRRLFVTWELLAFPQGQPKPIERPR